ncbi:MAG: hypothetical protein KKC68_02210, partial [Candidatus Thermoplasmatota archaeon]|nr:hypothetical protein [Candidatus Thermoplasmatota archaeon]MBU1940564.1 hypothetical protein [Candidatus Thermoplasmatota archaeon]
LCVLLVSVFIIDYVIAFGIVNIPLPGHKGVSATSLLSERTKDIGAEPAASSRMQLLKPLLTASLEQPIFGKGFGATVTYQSADPRILEQEEGGLYTTHAFEWGYLGFLYKFGIIGLIIYGYLIYSIYKHGLKGFSEKDNERTQNIAILFGISALLVTHFFTPYLDHPLGIGWIMVSSLVLTIKNR